MRINTNDVRWYYLSATRRSPLNEVVYHFFILSLIPYFDVLINCSVRIICDAGSSLRLGTHALFTVSASGKLCQIYTRSSGEMIYILAWDLSARSEFSIHRAIYFHWNKIYFPATHLSSAHRTHIVRWGAAQVQNVTAVSTRVAPPERHRVAFSFKRLVVSRMANICEYFFLHITQSISQRILFELCAYLLPDACLSFVSIENARFHTFLVLFPTNKTIAAPITLIWAININCVRCMVLTQLIIVSNVFHNCFALATNTRRKRSREIKRWWRSGEKLRIFTILGCVKIVIVNAKKDARCHFSNK